MKGNKQPLQFRRSKVSHRETDQKHTNRTEFSKAYLRTLKSCIRSNCFSIDCKGCVTFSPSGLHKSTMTFPVPSCCATSSLNANSMNISVSINPNIEKVGKT